MNIENIVQILKDNYNYVMIIGVVLIMVILGFVAEKTKFSLSESEEDKDEKEDEPNNNKAESSKLIENVPEKDLPTEVLSIIPEISSNIDDLIYQIPIQDNKIPNSEEIKLPDVDNLDELYAPLTMALPTIESNSLNNLDTPFLNSKTEKQTGTFENKINIKPSKVVDNNKELTPIKLTPIADESILAKFITEAKEERLPEKEPQITKIETNNQEETLEEVEPFKILLDETEEQPVTDFQDELEAKTEPISKLEDTMTNLKISQENIPVSEAVQKTVKEESIKIEPRIEDKIQLASAVMAVKNNVEVENVAKTEEKEKIATHAEESSITENIPVLEPVKAIVKEAEKPKIKNRTKKNKNKKKKKQNNFDDRNFNPNKEQNNFIKKEEPRIEETKNKEPKETFITSSDEDVWKF